MKSAIHREEEGVLHLRVGQLRIGLHSGPYPDTGDPGLVEIGRACFAPQIYLSPQHELPHAVGRMRRIDPQRIAQRLLRFHHQDPKISERGDKLGGDGRLALPLDGGALQSGGQPTLERRQHRHATSGQEDAQLIAFGGRFVGFLVAAIACTHWVLARGHLRTAETQADAHQSLSGQTLQLLQLGGKGGGVDHFPGHGIAAPPVVGIEPMVHHKSQRPPLGAQCHSLMLQDPKSLSGLSLEVLATPRQRHADHLSVLAVIANQGGRSFSALGWKFDGLSAGDRLIEGQNKGPLIHAVSRNAGGGSVGPLPDHDGLDESRMHTGIHRHYGRRAHQETGGFQRALVSDQVGQAIGPRPGGTRILIENSMRGVSPVKLQSKLYLHQTRRNRGDPSSGIFARRGRRQRQG